MTEETYPGFHAILVPVDFSANSAYSFCLAGQVAAAARTRVIAIHVVPTTQFWSHERRAILAWASVEEEAAQAQRLLDSWASRCIPKGVEADLLVRTGTPDVEILSAARALSADLIVLPWRRHRTLRRWLVGSVGSQVVGKVRCAVLATGCEAGRSGASPVGLCARALVTEERSE
jgi:nucleotide-binding universal stress UspA family protein